MKSKILLSLFTIVTSLIYSSCSNTPVARPITNTTTGEIVKDHYISPFPPYNPIVAQGFQSGQLAGDPSTIKVDPTTGKPNQSTMKIFKIP